MVCFTKNCVTKFPTKSKINMGTDKSPIATDFVSLLSMQEEERNEGWHNVPPQNMLLWHRDYFELKTLKIQQIEKGYSGSPFFLPEKIKAPYRRYMPFNRRKVTFLAPEMGS